ncbi:MAG TPA: hypothetical protein PKD59_12650 [Miltoncostaeaceae bacterium]|nr:hypothetical protein [Miltoncostaeaceae bacterium]
MRDDVRDLGSYTAAELTGLTRLELAGLAMRAEEESASLWDEHQDERGRVPAHVEDRAIELSSLSDLYAQLARRAGEDPGYLAI